MAFFSRKWLKLVIVSIIVLMEPLAAEPDEVVDDGPKHCEEKGEFVTCNDGVKVFYRRRGNKKKQAIVFIHDWGQDSQQWRCEQKLLCPKYFTVAVDLLGCGKSDKPDTDAAYMLSNVTNHVICVINALNLKNPIVVGHSIGAIVAAQLVLDGIAANKLVMIDSTSQISPYAPTNVLGFNGPFLMEFISLLQTNNFNAGIQVYLNTNFAENCHNEAFHNVKKQIHKQISESVKDPLYISALQHYSNNFAQGNWNFTTPQLQTITIPTLIINGSMDKTVAPAASESLRDQITNSFLVMFHGKYHFPFLTDHMRFHSLLLGFLNGTDLNCTGCGMGK